MDDLRGQFGAAASYDADGHDYALGDEDVSSEPPPSPVGQDERRMQVRAYNHWASLLEDRNIPSIEDLDPESLPDFGPFSVLLDFTNGIDNPAIRYLGATLAAECDVPVTVGQLDDVPARSLLSRITDHYMQIIANQAPIGFEAEFVNQRGSTIMYRGILLPYSSDDDTIDFIYGVINWKEIADQLTSDELLLEIDQALEAPQEDSLDKPRMPDPVTDWADGPGAGDDAGDPAGDDAPAQVPAPVPPLSDDPFPLPAFGNDDEAESEDEEEETAVHDLYESIEAVDDEPEGPSRFASLLTLGGGSASRDAFGDEDEEDYGDDDEDPVAKWLKRPTPLDALPEPLSEPLPEPLPEPPLPEPAFGREAIRREPLDLGSFAGETMEPDLAPEPYEPNEALEPEFAALPETEVEAAAEADAPEPEHALEYEPEYAPEPLELVDAIEPEAAPAPVPVEYEPVSAEYAPEPAEHVEPVSEVAFAALETPDNTAELGLYDCLAAARELAHAARSCEDRSRTALYAAVGRAYDFSLAAQAEPEAFAELIADSGLTVQERAPMTPVVKLVFGADYDKTRIAEYASVLNHAHRVGIERGTLADYLGSAEGGLKGVVQAERDARKADSGDTAHETPREALARKLRAIAPLGFENIDAEGEEFALVMIRRVDGEVVVLGEIADAALVEKAAKKLVA